MTEDDRTMFLDTPGSIYLNAAGTGPRLRAAQEAAHAAVEASAPPTPPPPGGWFGRAEALRSLAATTLGTDAEALAFIPSASYGVAIAARNLPLARNRQVVLMSGEYASNRNIWLREAAATGAEVRQVAPPVGGDWTQALLAAIDARTAVVSATPCHWTDGAAVDLQAVGDACRAVGSALVVDASQSLGALPFAFDAIQPDFVMTAGHKWLLGALGLGWLWASPRWRTEGVALEENWVARDDREHYGTSYGDALPPYLPGARRFDAGSYPSAVNLAMATAGMQQLHDWGVAQVAERLGARTRHLAEALRDRGLEALLPSAHVPHFLGLRLPEAARKPVFEGLRSAGIVAPLRGEGIRIAPHLHLGAAELDTVADQLVRLLA